MAPRRGQETEALTKGHLETERRRWKQAWSRPGCRETSLETVGGFRSGKGRACQERPPQRQRQEGSRATACPACPQVQEVQPITSYDAAGSFLLLGCSNGSIYYVGEQQLPWEVGEGERPRVLNITPLLPSPPTVDVQKFPLRMKDNDLLVSELYRDPAEDGVTALSVYLTPKTSKLLPDTPPPPRHQQPPQSAPVSPLLV